LLEGRLLEISKGCALLLWQYHEQEAVIDQLYDYVMRISKQVIITLYTGMLFLPIYVPFILFECSIDEHVPHISVCLNFVLGHDTELLSTSWPISQAVCDLNKCVTDIVMLKHKTITFSYLIVISVRFFKVSKIDLVRTRFSQARFSATN